MPNHPEAPDRICRKVQVGEGRPCSPFEHREIVYLRSTPARLAADQMLEALKLAVVWHDDDRTDDDLRAFGIDPTWGATDEVLKRFRAAIAAVQGEDNG